MKIKLLRIGLIILSCVIILSSSAGVVWSQDPMTAYLPIVGRYPMTDLYMPFLSINLPGTVTGTVFEAGSPIRQPVPGAKVCVNSLCAIANAVGKYQINNAFSGRISASAVNYNPVAMDIEVLGRTPTLRDIALSRKFAGDQISMRIVLTWDSTPAWPKGCTTNCTDNDLNAHLWLDKPGPPTHIFYGYPGDCFTFPSACLEQEYRRGFGPETIAIRTFENATYYYGVLNENQAIAGVPKITALNALVQLYNDTGLLYTFEVPKTGSGDFWYIFSLTAVDQGWTLDEKNCIIPFMTDPVNDVPQCP